LFALIFMISSMVSFTPSPIFVPITYAHRFVDFFMSCLKLMIFLEDWKSCKIFGVRWSGTVPAHPLMPSQSHLDMLFSTCESLPLQLFLSIVLTRFLPYINSYHGYLLQSLGIGDSKCSFIFDIITLIGSYNTVLIHIFTQLHESGHTDLGQTMMLYNLNVLLVMLDAAISHSKKILLSSCAIVHCSCWAIIEVEQASCPSHGICGYSRSSSAMIDGIKIRSRRNTFVCNLPLGSH
jgi:hypothetical protein